MSRPLSVKQVAAVLGVSSAEVYAKIKRGSLQPAPGHFPVRILATTVRAYQHQRDLHGRGQRKATRRGLPTATATIERYLRTRPPRRLCQILAWLHTQGIGQHWATPQATVIRLLSLGPFARVSRGVYTVVTPPQEKTP